MNERDFLDRTDVRRALKRIYNGHVWHESLPSVLALQRSGIKTIVLKSLPQVEDLYGDRGGRLSHDVDLLVSRHDVHRAIEILQAAGWQHMHRNEYQILVRTVGGLEAARRQSWHLVHPDDASRTISVDLHSDGMPVWYDPPLDAGVWERANRIEFDNAELYVLSPEDRLIYLCWHYVADGMPREKLVDIQRILRRDQELDWAYVARRTHGTGMTLTVYLVCGLADPMIAPDDTWRRWIPRRAPVRGPLLRWVARRVTGQMGQRATIAFRSLAYDDLRVVVRAWRWIIAPDRAYLVSHGFGGAGGSGHYLRLLLGLHLKRLRRRP